MAKKNKSGDADYAAELVEEIENAIGEVAVETVAKNSEFFESVSTKSKDILKTIQERDFCTSNQINALKNMLDGVRRWTH